jgi:hypothetical protein
MYEGFFKDDTPYKLGRFVLADKQCYIGTHDNMQINSLGIVYSLETMQKVY